MISIILFAVLAVSTSSSVLYPTFISHPFILNTRSNRPTQNEVSQHQNPNPKYMFSYDVNDPMTGDVKNQREHLMNGRIQGQYSFIQPDGMRRIVDYTADVDNGFNAVVKQEPVDRRQEMLEEMNERMNQRKPNQDYAVPRSYAHVTPVLFPAPVIAKDLLYQRIQGSIQQREEW